MKNKCERVANLANSINDYLVEEKNKFEDEVNKAKSIMIHYVKLQKLLETKMKRHLMISIKKLDEKQVIMNNGKNEYLIKINVANRLKDKYYYQDVPEILDYLQELNEDRVELMNKLLKNASIIERNSADKVKEKLHAIDQTIEQNNPKLDITMFIKHNAVDWKEPQDFYFIPVVLA